MRNTPQAGEYGGMPRDFSGSQPMRIPYVIDNQSHKMADILNGLLGQSLGESMDEFAIVDALGGVSG